jgi:OmpA family protein/FecR-like protein
MKKILFISFILFFMSLNAIQVYFLLGTTDLTEESILHIAKFKEEFELFFQENPNTTIFITGHTDNTGTWKFNRELSQNRADLIEDYLVNELDVNPEFTQTNARGSDEPISSNDTPEGRYLNRRVEIVFEKSEAQVKWLQNVVEYIPSKSGDVLSAKQYDELFRYDKINTESKSRSGIEFNDKNLLILEENSLMVIFGEITSSFSELLDDKFHVELKYGRLYNKLENMKGKPMNVKTPAADLELYSSLNDVEYSNNQTLTSVYEGYGLVLAQGETVKVNEGFGVKVETGKEPEPPVKLPDVPGYLNIADRNPLLDGEKVYFNWEGQAEEYSVQIALDDSFENVIREEKVSENSIDLELGYGTYFVRTRAIDSVGLKSDYSPHIDLEILEQEFIVVKNLTEGEIYGAPLDSLILEGSTIEKISVLINNKEIEVSADMNFSKNLELNYGMNTYNITALLPNGTEKRYNYRISYKPDINREIIFRDLTEEAITSTNTEDFQIIADAPGRPEMFLDGSEMYLDETGHLDHSIKLIQGEDIIRIRAEFIDGSENIYNFRILYRKDPELCGICEFFGYFSTILIPAIPFLINSAR